MIEIQLLDSRHCAQMAAHLLSLGDDDRADRFMSTVNDDYLHRYLTGIGYARDILIGAFNGSALVGLAHAAVYLERGCLVAEVGISVDANARRLGLGKRLLLACIDVARRRQVRRVLVLFRGENRAMAALTRSVGGRVERQGSEAHAVVVVDANQGPVERQRSARVLQMPAGSDAATAAMEQVPGPGDRRPVLEPMLTRWLAATA